MLGRDLIKKVRFAQCLEGGEGLSVGKSRGEGVPSRGKAVQRPRVGEFLACFLFLIFFIEV